MVIYVFLATFPAIQGNKTQINCLTLSAPLRQGLEIVLSRTRGLARPELNPPSPPLPLTERTHIWTFFRRFLIKRLSSPLFISRVLFCFSLSASLALCGPESPTSVSVAFGMFLPRRLTHFHFGHKSESEPPFVRLSVSLLVRKFKVFLPHWKPCSCDKGTRKCRFRLFSPVTFILHCLCFVNILEEGGVEFALTDLPVITTLGTLEVGFTAYFVWVVFSFLKKKICLGNSPLWNRLDFLFSS